MVILSMGVIMRFCIVEFGSIWRWMNLRFVIILLFLCN